MKGLILIRGMSFREQGAYNRMVNENCPDIYARQMYASKSHLKLINSLISKNHEVDVAFDTIECNKTNDIIQLFGKHLKYKSLKNTVDPDVHFALFRAIIGLEVAFHYLSYDFFLIIRNDMFLKDFFIENFNPTSEKIMFSSVLWYQARKTILGNPRVNESIIFLPKKFIELRHCLPPGPGFDHHDILDEWLKVRPDLEYDFYARGYYCGCSATEKNPLYLIVNRPEAKEYLPQDKRYPEDF